MYELFMQLVAIVLVAFIGGCLLMFFMKAFKVAEDTFTNVRNRFTASHADTESLGTVWFIIGISIIILIVAVNIIN